MAPSEPTPQRAPDTPFASATKSATTGLICAAIGFLAGETWVVPPIVGLFEGGSPQMLDTLRTGIPVAGASVGLWVSSFLGSVARDAAARGAGVVAAWVGRLAP